MFQIEDSVGFLLAKCHQKAFNNFRIRLEKYGITPPQFAALSFLWRQNGINQIQLGELMNADRTTISGIIERLERIGLVERQVDPKDRRSSIISVTHRGENIRGELEVEAKGFNEFLTRGLSKNEVMGLIRNLNNIKNSL